MREILNSRIIYYVGYGVSYVLISKLVGFENTILICMGVIIGEQSYLQYLNQNKDE